MVVETHVLGGHRSSHLGGQKSFTSGMLARRVFVRIVDQVYGARGKPWRLAPPGWPVVLHRRAGRISKASVAFSEPIRDGLAN